MPVHQRLQRRGQGLEPGVPLHLSRGGSRTIAAGTLQPTLWVTILAQISGAPLDLVCPKQAV
jgi:hypothetical protein